MGKPDKQNQNSQNTQGTKKGQIVQSAYSSFKKIDAKEGNQKRFAQKVEQNDVIVAVGPAGTGKTLLSLVFAIAAYKANQVERILLTRPLVTVGKDLGYMPGTEEEKIYPYMAPFLSAIDYHLGKKDREKLFKEEVISFVPLAFMRGQTLHNTFIIADEMQNSTTEELEMLVTRFGEGSKMIITGDPSQSDLSPKIETGLHYLFSALGEMSRRGRATGISCVQLDARDIARHPIVRNFVEGFDELKRSKKRPYPDIPKALLD